MRCAIDTVVVVVVTFETVLVGRNKMEEREGSKESNTITARDRD